MGARNRIVVLRVPRTQRNAARWLQYAAVAALTIVAACRSPKSEVEPGAALLHVRMIAGDPVPDSLLVWAYDQSGALWNRERVPKNGTLTAVAKDDLGTILVQPGQLQGALRIHIVGMQAETRVSDGVLSIDSVRSGPRTFDVLLVAAVPVDADGDGVPDEIDDCTVVADPAQVAGKIRCESDPARDAGPDVKAPDARADERQPNTDDAGDALPAPDLRLPDSSGTDDIAPADDSGTGDGKLPLDDALVAPDVAPPDTRVEPDLPSPDLAPPPDAPRDPVAEEALAPDGPFRCDAPGACGKGQGAQCTRKEECASGECVDGVCCTNACAGACRSCSQPNAVGVCQGYAMGTNPEGECMLGATCNGAGACGAPPSNLANGQLCTIGSQCASRNCKDGVCCNSACSLPCQTCGTGVCLTVKRADDVPECAGVFTCNGAGTCVGR